MIRSRRWMVAGLFAVIAGALVASTANRHPVLPNITRIDGTTTLPNGWVVSPAGRAIDLPGDLPLKMAFTPDGSKLLVVTGGWHNQGLSVIDTATDKGAEFTDLGNAWAGIALDGSTLYVSGGISPIRSLALGSPVQRAVDVHPFSDQARKQFVGGLVAHGGALYADNTSDDAVLKLSGIPLGTIATVKVGYRPYSLALSPDGKSLAVSNWGDSSISLVNPDTMRETLRIKVGSHPNEMVWSSDRRLFVADAGSNDVSVIKDQQGCRSYQDQPEPTRPSRLYAGRGRPRP